MGDRRIGVAISDALGLTAQPLTVLARRGALRDDVQAVCDLVAQHRVERVVIGLPLTMRGEAGIQAEKVTAFADTLRRRLDVPIQLVDERLTTVQGSRALRAAGLSGRRQRHVIDRVAAQLILQQFLETVRSGSPHSPEPS